MLTKEIIFEDFRRLKTSEDKVKYLQWLREQSVAHLQINFDKLIEVWSSM